MTKKQFLLICLAEECGELVQAITKCLTFGMESSIDNHSSTNYDVLIQEINDVLGALTILEINDIIDFARSDELIDMKISRIMKKIKYANENGIINNGE